MTLTEMGQRLLELRATKDALEAQTKENNAAIEALKKEMAQQMVDDDTPKFVHAGHSFSLLPKPPTPKRGMQNWPNPASITMTTSAPSEARGWAALSRKR